jgi:hypothetical protein
MEGRMDKTRRFQGTSTLEILHANLKESVMRAPQILAPMKVQTPPRMIPDNRGRRNRKGRVVFWGENHNLVFAICYFIKNS